MCLHLMSKQVFKARVPGCPSVCAALCGMEVPAHNQGLPHIPGQISRTPGFLPHAHIPHISPKPRTHGAPRRTYPAGRPHIPPNLRTYPPRPRVNMKICLHAHIPEVPAHIPPYGGRFWVHRGGGPGDPPRAPWRAMGPIWGVGDMCGYVWGYVRPIKLSGFDFASFGGGGFWGTCLGN